MSVYLSYVKWHLFPEHSNILILFQRLLYRYVLEWLSSMVSAGIMKQDPDTRQYTVPEGHKEALLTSAGFAPITKYMGMRAKKVKACFVKDGPWGRCTNVIDDIKQNVKKTIS